MTPDLCNFLKNHSTNGCYSVDAGVCVLYNSWPTTLLSRVARTPSEIPLNTPTRYIALSNTCPEYRSRAIHVNHVLLPCTLTSLLLLHTPPVVLHQLIPETSVYSSGPESSFRILNTSPYATGRTPHGLTPVRSATDEPSTSLPAVSTALLKSLLQPAPSLQIRCSLPALPLPSHHKISP